MNEERNQKIPILNSCFYCNEKQPNLHCGLSRQGQAKSLLIKKLRILILQEFGALFNNLIFIGKYQKWVIQEPPSKRPNQRLNNRPFQPLIRKQNDARKTESS